MRSRAAAGLLLLAVTAHAFVAGATHFHRASAGGAQSAHLALTGRDAGGRGDPLGGDDAQCLLCRLQRNLVTEALDGALTVAPLPAESIVYAALGDASACDSRAQLPPGRAPPSV